MSIAKVKYFSLALYQSGGGWQSSTRVLLYHTRTDIDISPKLSKKRLLNANCINAHMPV